MLANPYITAVVVPLILILCSAVAKKLVRGSAWQRSDFFLGVELSLAAMAAGLVHFLDLSKPAMANAAQLSPQKTTETAAFVAICFFLLLWILSTHQDWEKRPQKRRRSTHLAGGYLKSRRCWTDGRLHSLRQGNLGHAL